MELPRRVVGQIARAVDRGFVVVPVDAAAGADRLHVRFKHLPVALVDGVEQSCTVVFSSSEMLTVSGLPVDTPYATPSPVDLAQLVGPDTWIALDPGAEDVVCMPIGAFIGLWNQIRLASSH